MNSLQIRKLTYSALYLAIAMVLPFVTGQIPEIGAMLCPMHIPALLCGFMCGWPWGVAVGFIAPLLRSVLFGMPVLFPTAVAMAFELAVYGGTAGILYQLLPRKKWTVYLVLILSMIAGRIVWGMLMNTPESIFDQAYSYMVIIFGGMAATICYSMFAGILRAFGNSKTPPAAFLLPKVNLLYRSISSPMSSSLAQLSLFA